MEGPSSRYRRLGPLEQGGMGEVWRAEDTLLHRAVLVKRPRGDLDDADLQRRFRREAEVAARLDQHPGIVPVYDHYVEDGVPWIVMRAIPGADLGARIAAYRKGDPAWPLSRLLEALQRASEAIAFAHTRGVVHADLKPANIMVGEYGEVVVIDWGLAHVLADAPDPEASLDAPKPNSARLSDLHLQTVRDGRVVGTVAYMSPEQASGDTARTGAASDIWSLGAVLYEILAGAAPYNDSSPSLAAYRAQDVDFVPIRRRAPKAPAELVSVAERAMRLDPAERYADALAFAAELGAWREGRPVAAHRYGVLSALARRVRRRPERWLAAVVVLVAVVVLGALALSGIRRAESETRAAWIQGLRRASVSALEEGRVVQAASAAIRLLEEDLADPLARGVLMSSIERGPRLVAQWPLDGAGCRSLRISPNGDNVAHLDMDGTLRVFDGQGLRWEAKGGAYGLAWAPDGRQLATQEPDKTRMYDAASGALVGTLNVRADYIGWTRAGDLVPVARHASVKRYNQAGQVLATGPVLSDLADAELAGPDERLVAYVEDRIALIDLSDGAIVGHLPATITSGYPRGTAQGVLTAPPVGSGARFVRLFSAATGELLREIDPGARLIGSAELLSNGRFLWLDANNNLSFERISGVVTIPLGDTALGSCLASAEQPDQVIVAEPRWLRVWSPPSADPPAGPNIWGQVAFASSGLLAGVQHASSLVLLWDTSHSMATWQAIGARGNGVALAPDGSIYWTDTATTIRRDGGPDGLARSFEREARMIYALDRSADGRYLAGCGERGLLEVWAAAESGAPLVWDKPESNETSCFDVAFSPDSHTLASSWFGGFVLTDPTAPETPRRVISLEAIAGGLAWSPDGARLAVGDAEGELRLVESATGSTIWRRDLGDSWVDDVAWSADGRLIAATNRSGAVDLYSPDGTQLARLPRAHNDVRAVAFSPDGRSLAIGGWTLDLVPVHALTISPAEALTELRQRWGLVPAQDDPLTLRVDEMWAPSRQ